MHAPKLQTLALDMDGVTTPMLPRWLDMYNADYGDTLTPDQVTTYDLHKIVKPACGHRIYEYLYQPDIYHGVLPNPGTLEVLAFCHEHGIRPILATKASHHGGFVTTKMRWLMTHLPKELLAKRDILFVQDKSLVRADALVDDDPKNLAAFPGVGLLFDMPHNRAETTYTRIMNMTHLKLWLQEQVALPRCKTCGVALGAEEIRYCDGECHTCMRADADAMAAAFRH